MKHSATSHSAWISARRGQNSCYCPPNWHRAIGSLNSGTNLQTLGSKTRIWPSVFCTTCLVRLFIPVGCGTLGDFTDRVVVVVVVVVLGATRATSNARIVSDTGSKGLDDEPRATLTPCDFGHADALGATRATSNARATLCDLGVGTCS